MIVLHDPATLLHETVELLGAKIRPALESPSRIEALVKCLQNSQHDFRLVDGPTDTNQERLLSLVQLTHKSDYIDHLQKAHGEWVSANLIGPSESILPECFVFTTTTGVRPKRPVDIYARAGYYAFDMSSGIMNQTFRSAIASANLALEATDLVMQKRDCPWTALALCRPPGHHCDGMRAGGYCYINNAALIISAWHEQNPAGRAGILDIDFHHGNGTQEIFYNDPQVFYASIHGENEFPYYTGAADERGGDMAGGTNLNLPLQPGSSFDQYLQQLDTALTALGGFDLGFLVVSLGFDTFHLDPLGSFRIETDDYCVMARNIRQRLNNMPAVILFEGGYVIEHLGTNMLSFLRGWEEISL